MDKKEVIFVLLNNFADWEGAYISTCLNMGVKPGCSIKYKVKTLSLSKDPISSIGGFRVLPDYDINDLPNDYAGLILIGGMNWFLPEANPIASLVKKAIAENKQIRFRYFDWGVDRRKHERPGEYFASPYALVWDNENYYLIAHSERHGLTHYRVDKMAKLAITAKPRVITEQARQLDLTRYGKTVFGMFSGTPQQVKLRFRNSLAGVVIDRFGKSAMLVPDGESHFTFTTEIVLSPVFYGWLAGFGEQAEIMFPASVREDFADLCRRTLSLYETSREE